MKGATKLAVGFKTSLRQLTDAWHALQTAHLDVGKTLEGADNVVIRPVGSFRRVTDEPVRPVTSVLAKFAGVDVEPMLVEDVVGRTRDGSDPGLARFLQQKGVQST